jgi:hypothetical protein
MHKWTLTAKCQQMGMLPPDLHRCWSWPRWVRGGGKQAGDEECWVHSAVGAFSIIPSHIIVDGEFNMHIHSVQADFPFICKSCALSPFSKSCVMIFCTPSYSGCVPGEWHPSRPGQQGPQGAHPWGGPQLQAR